MWHVALTPLVDPDELRTLLAEHGVTRVPDDASPGVLDLALFFAERQKRVRFPEGPAPGIARFRVEDARVEALVLVQEVRGVDAAGLEDALEQAAFEAERAPEAHVVLGLDGAAAGLREYEMQHALWGRVTLFDYPHKPGMPRHPEVHAARERGWGSVLKERNLLPGRGIVVEDGNHGLVLTNPAARAFCAFLLRPATTPPSLDYNPFGDAIRDDPEFRFWLKWGSGSASPSEWVTMLDEHGADRPSP